VFLYPLFKRRISLCFTGLQVSNTARINLSLSAVRDALHCHNVNPTHLILCALAFKEFKTWMEGPLLLTLIGNSGPLFLGSLQ